jgi:hypothetical protein
MLLAGQGPGLAQARAALDLVGFELPGVPLRLSQLWTVAPMLGRVAKVFSDPQLGRRATVLRADVAAAALFAVPYEVNPISEPPAQQRGF